VARQREPVKTTRSSRNELRPTVDGPRTAVDTS